MNKIYARSPFIVEVDEVNQAGSKIEIFLWKDGQVAPSLPQHTLSKLIPSATNTKNYYNVSPYVREFLSFTDYANVYNTVGQTDIDQYCFVKVKRYKYTGSAYILLNTREYIGLDGYGYYEDGSNPAFLESLLDEGTYYYNYNPIANLATEPQYRAGQLTIEAVAGYSVKYTNLVTNTIISVSFGTGTLNDVYRVYPLWYADGNKVEVFDDLLNIIATYYFRPLSECRYEPIPVDFINKHGAWQREFFFTASFDSFETTSNQYHLMMPSINSYNPFIGQMKEFNKNGKKVLRLNTGIRGEGMNESIKQLLLSEKVIINGLPVKPRTTSQELLKDINTKTINYTLEFEYSYDMINSVL